MFSGTALRIASNQAGELCMRANGFLLLAIAPVLVLSAGCKKNAVDKSAFKSALNSYYAHRPDCLWPQPVKFPVQVDTSDDQQTKPYDALTDAGLLTRTPAEKKRFLVGSKQVNNYDLSPQGHSLWTADPQQPGYGNFCYGRPEATSIDGYTPTDDSDTRYNVTYHVEAANTPEWVNSSEVKTAFPKLAAATSGQQTATASIEKTANGWQVQSVQEAPPPANPMP
jgi:hypothetical protein